MGKSRADYIRDYMREYRQRKREKKLRNEGLKLENAVSDPTQRKQNFEDCAVNSILKSIPTAKTSNAMTNIVNDATLGPTSSTSNIAQSTSSASVLNIKPTEVRPHSSKAEQETLIREDVEQTKPVTDNSTKSKMGKSRAEYMRKYRQHKREKKIKNQDVKPHNDSNNLLKIDMGKSRADYMREYRQRKRQKKLESEEVKPKQSTSLAYVSNIQPVEVHPRLFEAERETSIREDIEQTEQAADNSTKLKMGKASADYIRDYMREYRLRKRKEKLKLEFELELDWNWMKWD